MTQEEQKVLSYIRQKPRTRYELEGLGFGNVQAILARLEQQGKLVSQEVPTPPGTNGRNRFGYKRVYSIKEGKV